MVGIKWIVFIDNIKISQIALGDIKLLGPTIAYKGQFWRTLKATIEILRLRLLNEKEIYIC